MRRLNNDQKGQGLLEFSLIFLILMMIVMGVIGFGLIFNAQLTINLAASAAARQAAVLDYEGEPANEHLNEPIYDAIIDSLILLNSENIIDITIYKPQEDGSIGVEKDILNKDGNPIYKNYPNELRKRDQRIGVQVRYTQAVIVPFVSLITGEEVEIARAANIRIE